MGRQKTSHIWLLPFDIMAIAETGSFGIGIIISNYKSYIHFLWWYIEIGYYPTDKEVHNG